MMQWIHDLIEWGFLHWPMDKKLLVRGGYVVRKYHADDNNSINCLVKESSIPERGTLVYFHGNSESMCKVPWFLEVIAEKNEMNIVSIEYRGYAPSEGKRAQRFIVSDILAGLQHLKLEFSWMKNRLIAVGQSLGSSVATHVVNSDDDFQRLILVNPFTSFTDMSLVIYHVVLRRIVGETLSIYLSSFGVMCSSYFTEGIWQTDTAAAEWMKPTMILASVDDELIPYYQKQKLHETFSNSVFREMEGGHNKFEISEALFEELVNFCKL